MTVTLNGERREIPDDLTIAALVDHLGMAPSRVAIERNREIVSRARWKEVAVQADDTFEIVHLVGGG